MVKFGFSEKLDAQLNNAITEIRSRFQGPWVAAFDADGTLWNTDMGEKFFNYQIQHCALPHMPADPWTHYQDLKEIDHPKAYLWLAQINAGQPFFRVQTWAQDAIEKNAPIPVFEPQKRLIAYLKEQGFQVYIVTASVKWAVEPAATLVGLTPEQVIGIQTEIKDGKVTDRQKGVITYKEGKVKAIVEATGGIYPHFCAGNTTGDAALLTSSQHTRLAICSKLSIGELAHTEEALQKLAAQENWLAHQF